MSLMVIHDSLETCRHFHCRKLPATQNGHDSVTRRNAKDSARNKTDGAEMSPPNILFAVQRLLLNTLINFVLIIIYLNKLTVGHSIQQV